MGVEVARDKKPQQQNQPQTWKNHDACTYKDINRNRHIDDLTDQQAIPFLWLHGMASMSIPQKRQFCVQNWYLHRALPASLLEKQQVAPPPAITTVENNASSKRRYAKDDRKSHLHAGAAQTDTCLNRIIDWIGPLECTSRAKQQRKSKHEMGRWLAVIVAKQFEWTLVLRNSFFMAR